MRINEYNEPLTASDLAADRHRDFVGGLWDDLGQLQLSFMTGVGGLKPNMKLLDLGCGCFRGGVQFLRYLQAGNYYGIDVNASLVEAGFSLELPKVGLGSSLSRDHVRVTEDFDASGFGVRFDRVIAVSLWTHLPLNHIQRSMAAVSRVLAPGGIFFPSLFHCPAGQDLLAPLVHQPGGIISHRDRDPYHYRPEDFAFLIDQLRLPLRMEWIGEWGHPRAQQMVAFHYTGGA